MIRFINFSLILLLTIVSCSNQSEKNETNASDKISPVREISNNPGKGEYTFNAGLKMAKKTGKTLIVDFFASWCTFCKKMERETYGNSDVKKKLENDYIRVRLYTDKPGSDTITFRNESMSISQFSHSMGVKGLPTVLFIDKDENLITSIPGYIEKTVFLPLLDYIGKKCYEKKVSFEKYIKNNKLCI
jgi:thioredoxin-related protein